MILFPFTIKYTCPIHDHKFKSKSDNTSTTNAEYFDEMPHNDKHFTEQGKGAQTHSY